MAKELIVAAFCEQAPHIRVGNPARSRWHRSQCLFAAVLSLSSSRILQGQEPRALAPGMLIPSAARLHPGCRRYAIYGLVGGKRSPWIIMTRQITQERDSARRRFKVVQNWDHRNGVESDTSVSWLDTLEPLSFHGVQQGVGYNLSFTAGRATGTRTPRDSATSSYEVVLDTPTYNEVIDDIMVSTLPLRTGYAVRYSALNPGDAPRPLDIQVMGSERLRLAGGGMVDTWVVRELGIGQLTVTWWFAKATREQLQMRVVQPDGAEYWRVLLYGGDTGGSCW